MTLIPHINTINVDRLKLSITTKTSGSYDVNDWLNKHTSDSNALVQKISARLMTVIQPSNNMGVDTDIKKIIEARDDNAYMYNFELILGMFFNANFRTSEYAKNYQEIITGILPALEKIGTGRQARQRNQSLAAREASQNDPNFMITTMKNNTIQMIVPRLVGIGKSNQELIAKDGIITKMKERYIFQLGHQVVHQVSLAQVVHQVVHQLVHQVVHLLPMMFQANFSIFQDILEYEIYKNTRINS